MKDLNGKTVFVTGAASGIGKAMARSFLAAGCRVALADIDEQRLAQVTTEFGREGSVATAVRLDVASVASWSAARRTVENALGQVDILCNNAGVGSARKPLAEMSLAEWTHVFDINVHGVFNGVSTFLSGMLARGAEAHIVNTASILGHFARPGVGEYVASKYAILGLSETLRMELAGTQVGVSVLCPGLVATRLGRPSGPDEEPLAAAGPDPTADPPGGARPPGVDAGCVGDAVVTAVRERRFYIFTHPEYAPLLGRRSGEIKQALASATAVGPAEDTDYLGQGFAAS
jgi:NAD(P)-dependent dehydrogenase (short-subunit alcohol dehydrogenase family)